MIVSVDLDGTLLPGATAFQAVLAGSDDEAFLHETDAAYFAGSVTLDETFWLHWERVARRDLQAMHRALRAWPRWLPGIRDGVARLHEAGARVVLLTDQPACLTDYLMRWGFDEAWSSPVDVEDGRVTAVRPRFDKAEHAARRLAEADATWADLVHVGNGVNDVPVWKAGANGVAVFAPPEVALHASVDLGSPASFLEVARAVQGTMESTV